VLVASEHGRTRFMALYVLRVFANVPPFREVLLDLGETGIISWPTIPIHYVCFVAFFWLALKRFSDCVLLVEMCSRYTVVVSWKEERRADMYVVHRNCAYT
jgi:hypothetical protein